MKTISMLLPTRGRPFFMEKVVASGMETAKNKAGLEFIFYIDNDDTASITQAEVLSLAYPGQIKYTVGERIVLSQMWNECHALAEADIFMHCGDDIVFQTKDWDETVLNAFAQYEDKIVFVHGHDGLQHQSFGTHGFLHKNWVTQLGYFVPPYFSSDYNDTWLNDVANSLGRNVYVPIYTEHMHPGANKYIMDQTHQDRLLRHQQDNVKQLYEDLAPRRAEDIIKLQRFIHNPLTP